MGTGCSSGYALEPGIGETPSFKIVLVGDAETGKTSVFLRYFKNQFDYSYRQTTTVSIENVVKKLNVPEHTVVSVTIWDLPGREEMDLRKSYYKDVDAAIVVVNIADRENVELAGTWKQDILNHAVVSKKRIVTTPEGSKVVTDYEPADHTTIPVLLLGNKYDLVEEREAMQEDGTKDADETKDGEEKMLIEENNKDAESSDMPRKDDDEGGGGDGGGGGGRDTPDGEKKDREIENPAKMEDSNLDDGGEKDRRTSEEKEIAVWKYEEQQEVEEVPPEIQFLEECADKHGFVGSVAVSAKNPDGGVHAAIQALIRHLLERKLKDKTLDKMAAVQVKRAKVKRSKPKQKDPKAFEPLEKTNIKELDDLFNHCNRHMSIIHEARLAYRQALRRFKGQCMEAEMVPEAPKCSIEDCIGGLKASLIKDNLELVTQDDAGFIQLVIQGEIMEEEQKSEDMRELLQTFHMEVAVASKTILHKCPSAILDLQELDVKIVARCQVAVENASRENPLTTRELRRIQDAVDTNRARIKHSVAQSNECLQDVDNSYKKIKAAMMW